MIKVTPGSFWDQFWDAMQPQRVMAKKIDELDREWKKLQRDLQAANSRLQSLVSDHEERVPADILKAIADLDWIIGRES